MSPPSLTYQTESINAVSFGKPILVKVKFSFDRASKKILFISCTIGTFKFQWPMNWFNVRNLHDRVEVFDPLRRKYVTLTPEEEVRQLTAHNLINLNAYPAGRIAVEYTLRSNRLERRCDLLVFSSNAKPWMIVECKAAGVQLSQATLDQVVTYSLLLPVKYVLITNGKELFCAQLDKESETFAFLEKMPDYE